MESSEEFSKRLEKSDNPTLELLIRFIDLLNYPSEESCREIVTETINNMKLDPIIQKYINEVKNEL